jgi:hypothetical protein
MASHRGINTSNHRVKQVARTGDRSSVYSPSVPISVYRELASQLQETQVQLDQIRSQNQQLLQQNHHLKQEAQQVILSTQRLQQLFVRSENNLNLPEFTHSSRSPQRNPSVKTPGRKQLVTEIKPIRNDRSENCRDFNGLKLSLVTIMVVLVAFSCGFFTVRPFLNNQR